MKHKLQLKIVFVMFISLLVGIIFMATSQAIYGYLNNTSAEKTQEIFEAGWYAFAIDFGFVAVVAFVFLILSRNIIKRIERLNSSIEQISKGNMKDTLSRSVHEMAAMLEQSLEKERAMVRNIAHDLRTPVTSIQGYAQLLEQSGDLSLQNKEYARVIQRKSIHLSEEIEGLLEYSILQFEEKEYSFEELSLSSLVEQILIDFIPQLEKLDMSFSLVGNEIPHMISCNQNLMIRLLENLINNAMRYGKDGHKFEISFCHISSDGSEILY